MDKLKKLEELFRMVDEGMTKDEFLEFSKNIVNFVKKIEIQNTRDILSIKNTVDLLKNKIENDNSLTAKEVKEITRKELENLSNKFTSLSNRLNDAILEIKDGEDGKDADEDAILERLIESIKIPTVEELKDDLPKMGTQVRDSLELLQGEDRLDASAIKGLEDLISKYKTEVKVGGGFNSVAMNFHMVDDETPTGLVNGSNKNFVIANIPSPSESLKVYKDGQRMKIVTDYTFSGVTITFLDAPLTGSIITCDYRT